jgi:cytochrome c oxidase assembly protein subunit 15
MAESDQVPPDSVARAPRTHDTFVARWLTVALLLVLLVVLVGGATRLTTSGLSITTWDPIMGVIPPLTNDGWFEAFDRYKETFEYRYLKSDISLNEFKTIYWWEWSHRLLARLLFLVLLIPFVLLLLSGRIERRLAAKIWLVLGLIALQGLVGWLMVESGLYTDVKVSPYRLALHLGLAALLFSVLVGLVLSHDARERPTSPSSEGTRTSARWLLGWVFLLVILGALVAGHRAGRIHTTWPLMEGEFIPRGLFPLTPRWRSLFEDPLTVQFFHRMAAYGLVLFAFLHWQAARVRGESDSVLAGARLVLWVVLLQVSVGIITVLLAVPVMMGLLHQLVAFSLLGLAVWHLYEIERHPYAETGPAHVPTDANPSPVSRPGLAQAARGAVLAGSSVPSVSAAAERRPVRERGADAAMRAEDAARRLMSYARQRRAQRRDE